MTTALDGRGRRRKGARGETAVVDIAKAHGFDQARRVFGSGSHGGGDVTGIPGTHLEVKCQESLNIWRALQQAETDARPTDLPVVVFKRNHTRFYAALPFDELLALLRFREQAP